jgi:hypothetical protein
MGDITSKCEASLNKMGTWMEMNETLQKYITWGGSAYFNVSYDIFYTGSKFSYVHRGHSSVIFSLSGG